MKKQIRSLSSILFTLFVIVGFNAFTNPSEFVRIQLEDTEGKIQTTKSAAATTITTKLQQIQQDYAQMNIRFDELAMSLETSGDSPAVLSGLSQILYVYDQEMNSVNFDQLTVQQKKEFVLNLNSLKTEFYTALSALSAR